MSRVALSRAVGLAAAALTFATAAWAEPTAVPLNGEASVGGVQVGCTGIGQSRHDPKWAAYPVRIDFAKPGGHFLADVAVSLSRADGTAMAEVSCQARKCSSSCRPGATASRVA